MAIADSEIDITAYIDHAMLNPTATPQQVEQFCIQAEQFNLQQYACILVLYAKRLNFSKVRNQKFAQ